MEKDKTTIDINQNQETNKTKYLPIFSYTKLSTLEQCAFHYKLNYIDKFYINDSTLATELGTLIHYIEETIARTIMAGQPINYEQLKDEFVNLDHPKQPTPVDILTDVTTQSSLSKSDKEEIYGIKYLSEKYTEEFYAIDDLGNSYYNKCQQYLRVGIYRLETFLKEHPELEIYDVEHEFNVVYEDRARLYGFIDRIFRNKNTGEFIIEDIKTKDKPFSDKNLITPLQFVVYAIGLKIQLGLDEYPIMFNYDLPLVGIKQQGGTKGFINRGIKKLDKLIDLALLSPEFAPKPTALCYWCPFSSTNPRQKEEGKYKCPYFSLWKPNGTVKSWECLNQWEGQARHEIILKRFLLEQQGPGKDKHIITPDFDF